jgi:ribosomal protein S27AE
MTAKLQSKNDECPLCESSAIYENSADDLTRRLYECPKCGTYEITEDSRSDLEGIAHNPNALEAYRKRIKADNENNVATVIERESKKRPIQSVGVSH